jgi:hypothetical protein
MINRIDAWMIALLFAGLMFMAWRWGLRLGRRVTADSDQDPGSKLSDATMALLGLLLAFTFALAVGRHDARRQMVIAESNAIADFYTCATLLDEPHRSNLQAMIRQYAQNELDTLRHFSAQSEGPEQMQRTFKFHNDMTALVGQAISKGTPIAINLTNTLNGITSANASRITAYEELVPWNTELMLLASCVVSLFLMGRQQGTSQKKCLTSTLTFIALISLVIYVIFDLNQPRRGSITVNYECMVRLVESISN